MQNLQPPLIIDAHAHLGPAALKWARMNHIDYTFLFPGPSPEDNQAVLQYCADQENHSVPYCRPELNEIPQACEQLIRYADAGARGVKLQPMTARFLPHDAKMYPLYETIQRLDLPITSHAGCVPYDGHAQNYADPSGWSQVAQDFPELKIVIAHLGGNYHHEALVCCEQNENILMDTAHLSEFCMRMLPATRPIDLLLRALRFCGNKKILFASEGMRPDFIFNCTDISLEDRKWLFWKNALNLIGESEV